MEKFFYPCMVYDYAELTEFLLRRYHTLGNFEGMSLKEFHAFYRKAQEQERKENLYLAWCSLLPHMDKDHYMTFQQYYDHCTGRDIDRRPQGEILAEVDEIRRKLHGNVTF